jgi:Ca2+-binding EF-hand superfamily protein
MKASLCSLIALLALPLHAQENEGTPRPNEARDDRKDERRRPMEHWKKADLNNDHKISKDEFLQLPRISQLPADKQDKLFSHLDKNQNGILEITELAPKNGAPQGDGTPGEEFKRRAMPRIAEMDKNGDRKISYEEFIQGEMISKLPEERRRKIFDNMDRNKDGFLSPEDGSPPREGFRRPDGNQDRQQGNPQRPNPERLFNAMDTTQDKVIDFTEFSQSPIAMNRDEDALEDMFERIDANKDHKIDAAEWKNHSEKAPAPPAPPRERPKRSADDSKEEPEMMDEAE